MALVLNLWIPGMPMPQPRPKAQLMRGPKPFVKIYTPNVADAWKKAVKTHIERAWTIFAPDPVRGHNGPGRPKAPLEGPLFVCLTFYFPRPQYMAENAFKFGRDPIPCGKKNFGDIDNLFKSTTDAMSDAGIWGDDGQIAEMTASKWYWGLDRQVSGCHVEVEALEDPEPVLFTETPVENVKRY